MVYFVGGLHFSVDGKHFDTRKSDSHFFGISRSVFTENVASMTGGAIFTGNPNALGICCECPTLKVLSTPMEDAPVKRVANITKESAIRIMENPNPCNQSWMGNLAQNMEGGSKVATTALTTKLCKMKSNNCFDGSKSLMLMNHTSGKNLEGIAIKLFDIFQRPAFGQPDMRLKITADSSSVSLFG